MLKRMHELEKIDSTDRKNGTSRQKRLRQIPQETGKFLSILASNCPKGEFVEIGTSAGYSTMWISLGFVERKGKIKTYELLKEKITLAQETFTLTDLWKKVDLIEGDALINIKKLRKIAFCFLDCEKEMYEPCWDILCDKIVQHGILIADNAINHYETIKPMVEKVFEDNRFDSLIVPIGKGELLCRRK